MSTETPYNAAMHSGGKGILGLIPLLKGQHLTLALTILSGIIAQSGTLATLAAGGWLAGKAIAGTPPQNLVPGFGLFAAVVVIAAAARWWQAHISHHLAFSLIETLQLGIYDGLERAAPNAILGKRTGELASVATSDAELMEHFYAHTVADYVGAIVVPLAALGVLFALQPMMAAALLPFLVLVGTVPYWLAARADEQGKVVMARLGDLNAETVEVIQGQRDIAAFGRHRDVFDRLLRRSCELASAQRRYGSRAGLEHGVIDALTAFGVATVVWVGVVLVSGGRLDWSSLPLALMLAGGALTPIVEVTQTARKLGELRAGAARILTIFHQKPQIIDRGIAPEPEDMAVSFSKVCFDYGTGRGSVLDGLDFTVSPGETVALVGRSGAGKSTTISLLLRFHDVSSGAIRIGDCDLRDLPLMTLRKLIAYVPQDVHLFNESVTDNIRLGRRDASLKEVQDAARLAQAHEFIEALPQGYDTICGEAGARLSGGQRQRIAIARALLMQSPILLLDEASSSLDNENERAFRAALSAISRDRTVILVAHRTSTIRTADRILVLEDGRIIESGSHDELLGRRGAYAKLIASEEGRQ